MAYFTNDDFQRLDYSLLQNSPIILYRRQDFLREDINGLKNLNYSIKEFDCLEWQDEAQFHEMIATGLEFPDYYGKNLDALNDCLSDLEIPFESGLVIVFLNFDRFAKTNHLRAWSVLDIFALNARLHLLLGRRLMCLIQTNDPAMTFEPVGAQPVIWNPREWLNKNRDL